MKSLIGVLVSCVIGSAVAGVDAPRYIVKFKNKHALSSFQSGGDFSKPQPMAGGAYVVEFKNQAAGLYHQQSIEAKRMELMANPGVEWVVLDRKGHFTPPSKLPSTSYSNILTHEVQWDEFVPPAGVALESAPYKLDGAWAYTTGHSAKPIVVAVLDTGVEHHPDLKSALLYDASGAVWGWNFADNDRNVHDATESWHGTHVSGTIAGYGQVMQGIGRDLKILTVKIPDASGMFYESAVVNAIYWAAGGDVPGVPHNPYPAKVINMSFGVDAAPGHEVDHCDAALQEAIKFARKKGVLLVAAAGNANHWEHYNAPAVCNHVLKVASTGPEGFRSYFSNYGPAITLAAPGGDVKYGTEGGILSTVHPEGGYLNSGYDFYQGTSMASPHVAGVAGLVYAVRSGRIKPQTVEQLLFATTHSFPKSKDQNKSCQGKKPCGHGILDALKAVVAASQGYDVFYSTSRPDSIIKDWEPSEFSEQTLNNNAITSDSQGNIFARIGHQTYRLKQQQFSGCAIVGDDGVGCRLNQ